MKVLIGCLLVALLLLQYRLWLSDEGLREVWQLKDAVTAQQAENSRLANRNDQLKAEVADLKQGLAALEERARHDLGMVSITETFYQVVDAPHLPPAAAPQESVVTRAAAGN